MAEIDDIRARREAELAEYENFFGNAIEVEILTNYVGEDGEDFEGFD